MSADKFSDTEVPITVNNNIESIKTPNRSVILITVDTTRPDRLEPYGNNQVATPALQNLANRGIVFEQAWAVSPITLVSHASILSGLYPFQHGVRNNGIHYVDEKIETLAERLRNNGYQTSAFVSAAVLDKRYGLSQGFEVYDDDLSDRRNVSPRMVADRIAESTVDSTLKWLDEIDEEKPFFSWVHFYDPHASYSPPPPFRDEYRNRMYDGEIAYMDQEIGRLLEHEKLLSAGDEAPIIIVIADHGESLGQHGEKTHALLAYDSTLHIPFIMHIPGVSGGIRIKESVGHVDVMPTILSLVDVQAQASDDEMSGRDLSPLIRTGAMEPNRPYYSETYLPYYTYGWEKLRVMRKGRWKLIEAPENELYDLMRDPRELSDLVEKHSDVSHDLQRDLSEWLNQSESSQGTNLNLTNEELSKLRSLGYLSVGSGNVVAREDRPNPMDMIGQHVGLEKARMLLADRFYQQAVIQLQGVLRKDPQNLAALIDLVRAHEGLGEYDAAIENAEHALELDPEYTQTYMTLSRLESQIGNDEKAIELINLALSLDPINPESHIFKAILYNKKNETEKTVATLTEALKINPDHPRLNAVYAHLVESRGGLFDEAEARLNRALEKDPFMDQAWRFSGLLMERLNRPQEALIKYKNGLKNRPDDTELHAALGHLLAKLGQFEQAEVQLREAVRLASKPRNELFLSLGGVLSQLGQLELAKKEYNKVLESNPEHPGARNNMAIAHYRTGQVAEAKSILEEVVLSFPNQADAHNNLAAIAIDQKNWSAAIKHSKDTLAIAPNLVEAWNNLAISQEETGDFKNALVSYEKALDLETEYWPAHHNLGLLLLKMEAFEAAKDSFTEVLKRVPNHADSHFELGYLYADVFNDNKSAKNHLNAFIKHGNRQDVRNNEVLLKISEL